MLAAGAPGLMLATGLRLQCQLWMTTGRSFNSLLAGLSGFAHAHPHADDMLRTVRAVCVRDVCRHDSSRGVELVRSMQVCTWPYNVKDVPIVYCMFCIIHKPILLGPWQQQHQQQQW